jgi:hypothetical protein
MFMPMTFLDERFVAASSKAFRATLVPVLLAAALIGGYEVHRAWETPGRVIRHDLIHAGSDLAALPWLTPRDDVRRIVLRHFPSYRATADVADFPSAVTVTLHDLDREACLDAYRMTKRIEGQTVIAMEPGGDMTCQDHAVLSWRIMP